MLLKRVTMFAKQNATAAAPNVSFEPTVVTVFVGPNNAGKSQALRDLRVLLEWDIERRDGHNPFKVVRDIDVPAFEETRKS